jgi:SAM-dependent methyltransferase
LKQAEPALEAGFCLNLDNYDDLRAALATRQFDTIIAGDVLEHTADPWRIVDMLFSSLLPGGSIFISLPNIAHWELILHWLRQSWPVNPRGIFDNTHRRFFMRRDLKKLAPPGSEFTLLHRTFRLFDEGHPRLDRVISLLFRHIIWFREYLVFQYIFAIRKQIGTA